MIRKLAMVAILVMAVSVITAGFSAGAATCRRVVVTILDDPYFAHPICTDLPLPVDGQQIISPVGGIGINVQPTPVP